jgi:Domain of unknown function (DUF4347)
MTIGRLTQQFLCTTSLGVNQVCQAPDLGRTSQPVRRKKNNKYLTLEPRMMFDGAMAITAAEVMAHDMGTLPDAEYHHTFVEPHRLFEALASPTAPEVPDDVVHHTTFVEPPRQLLIELPIVTPVDPVEVASAVQPHDIVFIDATLPDISTLIAAVPHGAEIFLIDQASDGLDQIAAILQGRHDVAAIHILSHGQEGQLNLGSGVINAANLAAHAADLEVIKSALAAHGDILLYGCDVAKGSDGDAFIKAIAAATGDDVAASIDLTGSAGLGGNWILEDQTGSIEARIIDARDWQGILAPLNITITGVPVVTGIFGTDVTTGLPITGVGGTALWSNAGFVGATAIDLKATVVSTTTAGMAFITQGDDASIVLTSAGDVVIKWEIFAHGTSIPAVGSPNFNIVDIDGAGGVANSRETVIPQLNGLTAYTLETVTHEVATVSASGVNVSGTQNETASPPVSIS